MPVTEQTYTYKGNVLVTMNGDLMHTNIATGKEVLNCVSFTVTHGTDKYEVTCELTLHGLLVCADEYLIKVSKDGELISSSIVDSEGNSYKDEEVETGDIQVDYAILNHLFGEGKLVLPF